MNVWIVILIIIILGGIIYVSQSLSPRKLSREDFLKSVASFVQGEVENFEGLENSFRIKFKYKDTDFVFEDIEDIGFQGRTFRKGYLKAIFPMDFTLRFSEKVASGIRADVRDITELNNPWARSAETVDVPQQLKIFHVYTNKPETADVFLKDPQIQKLLVKFHHRDHRGQHFMSFEISEGVVIIPFYATPDLSPNMNDLQSNVSVIEELIETKVMLIINKLIMMKLDGYT